MNLRYLVLTLAVIFCSMSTSAMADISNAQMNHCVKSHSADVCEAAVHYYLKLANQKPPLSHGDACQVGINLGNSEFVYGITVENYDLIGQAHGVTADVIASCDDPYRTKAKIMQNIENKVLEQYAGGK